MAAATSLASESPFHVACVHVCVGHTHRHDTAVISAGKLLPQMATRSPLRSWRSLLLGGAANASPERTARPRTPPPRPAQPPPSRGIGRRPLPHPGTRRRRAGSRTPRSRVAAGEREDPSSYGEGPVRPLKRVGPRAVVMLLGPRPSFPGRTTLRTGPVAPATLRTHELAASSPTSGVVTAIHGTGILRNAPQVRWGAKVRHTGRCCGLDPSERLRPYSRGDANLCDHGCPGLLVSGKSPAELLLDRARIHHSLGDAAAYEVKLRSGHGTRGLHGLFQAPAYTQTHPRCHLVPADPSTHGPSSTSPPRPSPTSFWAHEPLPKPHLCVPPAHLTWPCLSAAWWHPVWPATPLHLLPGRFQVPHCASPGGPRMDGARGSDSHSSASVAWGRDAGSSRDPEEAELAAPPTPRPWVSAASPLHGPFSPSNAAESPSQT